jgi:pimeloyl-ACP methyl ester carboxylesterase
MPELLKRDPALPVWCSEGRESRPASDFDASKEGGVMTDPAEATAHLTFERIRDQYIGGVPRDVAVRIDPRLWQEDWRIMSLPGRLETQRPLVLDYRNHVARFGEIAEYLARRQPPALMLWGRHDVLFDLEETLSWMKALPRMEAHNLDGSHFLLETHAAALIGVFLRLVRGN